jgi:hypothetical protein
MNEIKKESWANAKYNENFILIETYSGYRSSARDPEGVQHFLSVDADYKTLGSAVLAALKYSRWLKIDELDEFFDPEKRKLTYAEWVTNIMHKYSYKTKREMFKNMHSCDITVCGNQMTISPSRHEKLEQWGASKGDNLEDVQLSANADSEAIGKALRLAFSRCY